MPKKIVQIKDIGEVHLFKTKNAKSMKILLRPNKPPRVTIPYRLPFKAGELFLFAKTGWIKQNLPKIREIEKNISSLNKEEIKILREKAKNILPNKVENFSEIYNLKYKKLFLKNLKSRWGSCSSQNNINLNIHLAKLPEELIDYVILHELAHIKEKNHGKEFWGFLEKLSPHAKQLDKKLKKFSIK